CAKVAYGSNLYW
nr:immunoglobulin heavy chain junction region [Macaca mulatta]